MLTPPPPAPKRRAGSNCSSCGEKSPVGLASLPRPFAEAWADLGGGGPTELPVVPGVHVFGPQRLQICCPPDPPAPSSDVQPVGLSFTLGLCPQHPPWGPAAAASRPVILTSVSREAAGRLSHSGSWSWVWGWIPEGWLCDSAWEDRDGGNPTLSWKPGFTSPCHVRGNDDGCRLLWSY